MKTINDVVPVAANETANTVSAEVHEQAIQPAPSKAAAQTKRTKNMVLPYLVALVVGKVTIKEVTKTLAMTEAEVSKQLVDNLGPILSELADIAKNLGEAAGYFVRMEKKPEHREVLMEMLRESVDGSFARLSKLAGKV